MVTDDVAARTTKLPVMCAVKRPPNARKPIVSVLPAMATQQYGKQYIGERLVDGGHHEPLRWARLEFSLRGSARDCEKSVLDLFLDLFLDLSGGLCMGAFPMRGPSDTRPWYGPCLETRCS